MQNDRLLRRDEVEKICAFTTSTLYRYVKARTFPAPIRTGERSVRWPLSDVLAWVGSRPRTASDPAVETDPADRTPHSTQRS